MKYISLKILFISLFMLSTKTGAAQVNRIFLTQNRFYSASLKALADAGIALPADIYSGIVNPALTFSNHQRLPQSRGTLSAGYGKDSIFNSLIMPLGVTYSTSEGTIGLFYRFLRGTDEIKQYEMTINFAGQLFSKSDQQGAVDFGLNLRFEKLVWNKRPPVLKMFFADDSGSWVNEKICDSIPTTQFGSVRDKRFLLDVGFFQPQIWENVDFGLALRNLIGYIWTYGNTESVHLDTLKDSLGFDSAMVKTVSFTGNKEVSRYWTKGINRTLSAGIVYHTSLGSRLLLNLPIDFEILGLFDRDIKNRYVFRGGIEAQIGEHIILRLGYSRAPGKLRSTWDEISNINIFTGGAGLKISSASFNFYITEGAFGSTASIDY